MKKNKLLTLLGISIALNGIGQNVKLTDTVKIKEVVITSERIEQYTPGNKIQTINAVALRQNISNSLADIISLQSQIQINSYGKGALANPSFRGTGSAHTAVLWNGFNLQDILNGTVDFSQIPAIFLDDIKIQYGGCSALYGSGAIGGLISLDNKLQFDQGINASVTSSYGSFSSYFEGAEFRLSKAKYSGSIKAFYSSSENDYDYSLNSEPKQKLSNAQTLQFGTLFSNSFKLNEHQKISVHMWFQKNQNHLPFDMMMMPGKAIEKNQAVRNTAEWSRIGNKTSFTVRTGLFNNLKNYSDPATSENIDYKSFSSITEFENNLKLNSYFRINSGINYLHEQGKSPNLDKTHIRDRSAAFASVRYNTRSNSLKAVLSLRDELINSNFTPATYSAGIETRLFSGLNLKGNVNKSYRVPSFNDLYWNDMVYCMFGNPDLKNEEGFNEELGLNFKSPVKKLSYEIGITAFNSNVTNWILWQPVNNFSLWTPMNVNTVWSRGIEYNAGADFRTNTLHIRFSGMFSMLSATDESEASDVSVKGKQLIYVPQHKTILNVYADYKGFSLNYSHNFIGKRFTTADNLNCMKEYNTGNITVSKEMRYKEHSININFQVLNFLNKNYQVMQFYPMPPRNYMIGVKINFNSPNN